MSNIKQVAAVPLQGLLKLLPPNKKLQWKKLAVANVNEIRFIPFDDIIYCKSINNYTTVFVQSGKSYLCCKTLKEIVSSLPNEQFVRIHHSYLVNIQCITSLKKHDNELELNNTISLPISRTQKTSLYYLLGV
jgi:two-component system, LytTR family, response regulator